MAAVIDNDKERIKALIEEGENPNSISSDPLLGRTALSYAVLSNDPEIIELLLKAGANPNLPDRNHDVALEKAIDFDTATTNRINYRNYIITRSVSASPENPIPYDPEQKERDNNLIIIGLLIGAGANPYVRAGRQVTPFQLAAEGTRLFIKLTLNKKKLRELRSNKFTYLSVIPGDLIGAIENELR